MRVILHGTTVLEGLGLPQMRVSFSSLIQLLYSPLEGLLADKSISSRAICAGFNVLLGCELTNSMTYGTRSFNAAFTRALQ